MDETAPATRRLQGPRIDRMGIAYMAVAMRDPNLVHVEPDVAAAAGMESVIAHGTFPLGYAGAALTRAYGFERVRRLRVDLTAPVFPGDALTTELEVVGDDSMDGGGLVRRLRVRVLKADGTLAAKGEAEVLV